jgi:hypothetical protein
LVDYSHKLSIISKQSNLIHIELRYQVKHMQYLICQEEKISCKFSPNFFIFYLFLLLLNTCNMEITSYARQDQTCVSSMKPMQKSSRSTCFFCLPQHTCKVLSREIKGKTQLVSRLHTKYNK